MASKKTGRGPKISKEVRQLIISQAIHDSKTMPRRALAIRLQELIERMGEVPPTEDTLARMISEARNKRHSELDQPWSIGLCAYYNIPPDIIPLLIHVQQLREEEPLTSILKKLTVREAVWYNRLRPAVEALARLKFGFDPVKTYYYLSVIVSAYVHLDRVSEVMNEQNPDTSELDRIIFIKEDLSNEGLYQAWWSMLSEQELEDIGRVIEDKRKSAIDKLEQEREVESSPIDNETIYDFFNTAVNGPAALQEWKSHHPYIKEVKELSFDWIETFIEAKERKNNER